MSTAEDVRSDRARAQELPYGPLALALYAAPSLPYPRHEPLTAGQIIACAADGLEHVGADDIHRLYGEFLALNRALRSGTVGDRRYRAATLELLDRVMAEPGPARERLKRLERCIAYAWHRSRTP